MLDLDRNSRSLLDAQSPIDSIGDSIGEKQGGKAMMAALSRWMILVHLVCLAVSCYAQDERHGRFIGEDGNKSRTGLKRDSGMVQIQNFKIDRYEYPNIVGEYPLYNVSWYEAQAKCKSKGKRLCSEAEWERACTGMNNHVYPYGNSFDEDKCNTPHQVDGNWGRDRGIAKIGKWKECVSDYGVYDMSGNVWEWVDGVYSSREGWRVVKGGSWFQNVNFATCSARYVRYLTPDYRLDLIGFRCCQSPIEPIGDQSVAVETDGDQN